MIPPLRDVVLTIAVAIPAVASADATAWIAGRITTVAGVPGLAGSHDGPASTATFNRPAWLDVAAGDDCTGRPEDDIYVVDRVNQSIRRISGGVVSTETVKRGWADQSPVTFDFDGVLGGGIVMEPLSGGCGCSEYDRGMFVASSGMQQIVLVSRVGMLGNRDAFQLLGQPFVAGSKDGEATSAALFNNPTGLARSRVYDRADLDARALYVADTGNHTVRRINFWLSFEACPQAHLVSTLAGLAGVPGSQDGRGPSARFNTPRGIATGPDGGVYVADAGNHTIRRIAPDGTVSTIAGEPGVFGADDGPALQAHLHTPSGIDVNAAGEIFIADTGNNAIRMLTADGMLVTIAGSLSEWGFRDGDAVDARFTTPVGIRLTSDGTLLVADTSNNLIRRITPAQARRRAVRR